MGPLKKQKNGGSPHGQHASKPKASSEAEGENGAHDDEQGGFVSSSDDEGAEHRSEAVQELEEEVCRLHDQVGDSEAQVRQNLRF